MGGELKPYGYVNSRDPEKMDGFIYHGADNDADATFPLYASPPPPSGSAWGVTDAVLDAVGLAIERAQNPDRECPFGFYDYTSYGDPVPFHVRDFRDPKSADYGKAVFKTADRGEGLAAYEREMRRHMARAAISALTPSPSFAEGIEAAAKWVQKRLEDYINECGIYDPSTNFTEFRDGGEYEGELVDIMEGIRALLPAPPNVKVAP